MVAEGGTQIGEVPGAPELLIEGPGCREVSPRKAASQPAELSFAPVVQSTKLGKDTPVGLEQRESTRPAGLPHFISLKPVGQATHTHRSKAHRCPEVNMNALIHILTGQKLAVDVAKDPVDQLNLLVMFITHGASPEAQSSVMVDVVPEK